MTIGNDLYTSAGWIYPITYHPHSPPSIYISDILRSAYFSAQNNCQIISHQSYQFDRYTEFGVRQRSIVGTTGVNHWLGIARCWCDLPLQITHLHAVATLGLSTGWRTKIALRLQASDGTNYDTSTTETQIEIPEGEANAGAVWAQTGGVASALYSQVAGGPQGGYVSPIAADEPLVLYQIWRSLELVNVSPGVHAEIRLTARVNGYNPDGSFAREVYFRPFSATIWWGIDNG